MMASNNHVNNVYDGVLVRMANGQAGRAHKSMAKKFTVSHTSGDIHVDLGEVILYSGLQNNLMRMAQLTSDGWEASFKGVGPLIIPCGNCIGLRKQSGLYFLDVSLVGCEVVASNHVKVNLIHRRSCHLGPHAGCLECTEQKGQRGTHKKCRPEYLNAKKFKRFSTHGYHRTHSHIRRR